VPPAGDVLELAVGDAHVRERAVRLDTPAGPLAAVVAISDAPPSGLCVVFLNAGAVRRIGPNRLWVELARRWAARGVATMRLDGAGLGDSDGDDTRWSETEAFYESHRVTEVTGALDALAAQGLGERFVLVGLCSGGYWALHGALADDRVVAALPVNPGVLVWDTAIEAERDARKVRKLARPHIWRKILRGGFSLREGWAVLRALVTQPLRARRAGAAPEDPEEEVATHGERVDELLDALEDRGVRVDLVLTADEPVGDELRRDGQLDRLERWPGLTVTLLPGTVRAHTLRPTQLQRAVSDLLDRSLDRELARAAAEGAPAKS